MAIIRYKFALCAKARGLYHHFSFLAIAFISLVVSNVCNSVRAEKEPYEMSEVIVYNDLVANSWNGTWLTGDTFYYEDLSMNLFLYNVSNKSSTLLLKKSDLGDSPSYITSKMISLVPSPDLKFVLVSYNETNISPHSTMAQYKIFELGSNESYDVADKAFLEKQLVKWNVKGHSLAYVCDNDLYFLASPENEPRRLTSDGFIDRLYNGVANWVYGEEVLETYTAFWFSPDGNNLAYLKIDDRQVNDYMYMEYGKSGSLENQYPNLPGFRYPNAGTTNPTVSVFAIDLTNSENESKEYQIPTNLELNDEGIVFGLTWPTTREISFLVTNRVQNKSWVIRCSLQSSLCREESSMIEPNGWILPNIPVYSSDGTRTIDIQPAPEGNDTYYHLILTDLNNKNSTRLTIGLRRVTKILHWDESNNLAYYQSSIEGYPEHEHAFVVNTELLTEVCLTCSFSAPSVNYCSHGKIDISKDATYFAKICDGPNPDYVVITDSREAQPAITWEDNEHLRSVLETKLQTEYIHLEVPVANGYTARVRVYFPPDYYVFSENQDRVYPAIVGVSGAPDSDGISDKYESNMIEYWTTKREYIYIQIDGRGSGRDGRNKMFQVYRKLGTVEVEDQISVTRYLQQTIPQLDANNTGILGAGYGGFVAAMALTKDRGSVFKFAIAVTPITNFLYYDSIYTERYMGLPTEEDNLEGYKNTDVSSKIGHMIDTYVKDNTLLLIHGMADQNVHYKHSAMLMKKLQLRSVQFQQMSYPDEGHDLEGVTLHYHEAIDKFIENQFKSSK